MRATDFCELTVKEIVQKIRENRGDRHKISNLGDILKISGMGSLKKINKYGLSYGRVVFVNEDNFNITLIFPSFCVIDVFVVGENIETWIDHGRDRLCNSDSDSVLKDLLQKDDKS